MKLFKQDVTKMKNIPQYADPKDESLPVADRARSYLQTNCAHCHQPGGVAMLTPIDLRSNIPEEQMKIFGELPEKGEFHGAHFVAAPGNRLDSALFHRMNTRESGQMPPLGTHEVDPLAVDLIGRWIDEQR